VSRWWVSRHRAGDRQSPTSVWTQSLYDGATSWTYRWCLEAVAETEM